jgi:hypothetical protein
MPHPTTPAQAPPAETPIACSLDAAAYRQRTDELAALAARALRSRRKTPDGERLLFADEAGIEREPRAVIAAEAICCAFLRLDLTRAEEGLQLDISGPEDARPVIAELFT